MARGDFFCEPTIFAAADLANVTLAHQKRAPEYFEVLYVFGDEFCEKGRSRAGWSPVGTGKRSDWCRYLLMAQGAPIPFHCTDSLIKSTSQGLPNVACNRRTPYDYVQRLAGSG
jgi:hypothetical protein